ncbi:e6dfdb4e-c340-4126-b299-fb6952bf947f [Sclerotinia trifoliorum]|uniref:E6dfdb4e-c340-4126-b299-fb6952bf947f n=1 Tax=Sclerotinia trifoliorum TaxID=28548 RepID=A0A8H2ZRT2_9HELO|nr:e6dfdb4e-c340-4126-b299-fb6952bf947f [Sclerotinia trifoliorum]
MTIPDAVQTLSAAFSFGILLQAATGAFLIYFRGHGSNVFKDGRRLVLLLFLLFSVLWAQIDFLELLMPTTGTGTCQAGLIFTTSFDQSARVALEQFLLWSIGHGTKITAIRAILQGLLGTRLIVGGILAGVTRPQFAPTCVATTSILPVAIVVLVMDLIIVGALLVQAGSLGMFRDSREERKLQNRALLLVIAGFAIWTVTSVPMLLGIPSIDLIARTVVPANGLLVLIGIITAYPVALLSPKQEDAVTAGAKSPFSTSPMAISRGMFQNSIGDEGSSVIGRPGTKSQLFVANPSSTPTSRDVRGFTKLADDGNSGEAQNASGYQAPSGAYPTVFGASSLVTGQEVPGPATEQFVNPSISTPVSSKRPKVSVRGLAISKPIVNDETDPDTPFSRIATIDLKTAIMNDRERRTMASKKSLPNAPRADFQRSRMSPEDILNKANEVAQKGVSNQANEWMAASGLSTSALLSPARDEVRRRSPRGVNNLETLEEKQTFRPVAGLPMNPRSQKSTMSQQRGEPQPQTVMLVNDIIYDNPAVVESIISRTPAHIKEKSLMELSPLTPYTSGFEPRESIIQRARPIPRHKNTGLFGNEPLPVHRRSKSSSAILGKKFLLTSTPGSPSQLPPLPKPPPVYTASKLKKLLPNDTKSMTFEEKIEFLFPAPPGVSLLDNRRSSVPDLPSMASKLATSIELEHGNSVSKRTTTIALLTPQEYPAKQNSTEVDSNRETYLSDAVESVSKTLVANRNFTNENILELVSKTLSNDSRERDAQVSSPAEEGYVSYISPSNASDTYRGSSYSAFSPQRSQRFLDDLERLEIMSEIAIEENEGESDEAMVVTINSAENRKSMPESVADDSESFIFDINGLPVEAKHSTSTWHRRIGDELPTFSDRRLKHGSRKISPPTALLLEPARGRASPILIRNVEPSPALDSPGRALQDIKDQLNRIEQPRRASLRSILSRMPATENVGGFGSDDGLERLRLLETLEREMGEQENDWQKMHQNFSRDSMSSIGTLATPRSEASPELTRSAMDTRASQRLSLGLRRSSSRLIRQRMRDNSNGTSAEAEIVPYQIQESSSLGGWQQRLADAQMSYMENVPTVSHSRNSSMNFLSVSKAPNAPLESPTPTQSMLEIESESEYGSEGEIEEDERSIPSPYYPASLWQPVVQSPKAAASFLWSSANDTPASQSPEPPAKNIRPAQRQIGAEMLPSSGDLWSKPSPNMRPGSVLVQGLWTSKSVRSSTVKARPVTQRPPRRSKRTTLLADIVENPEPLPNKRDTLGIFQFPWGERSDTAMPQQTYNPFFQTGPALNAALDSRSRQLEPDSLEYSSTSFFEDYDEEYELGSDMTSESEDEFDETTLWEIASMLKSSDVPSKDSLLPPIRPSEDIVDDYEDYETSSETDFSSEDEDYEEFNNNNEYYGEYYDEARNSTIIFSHEDDFDLDDEVDPGMAAPVANFYEENSEDLFVLSGDSPRVFVEDPLLLDNSISADTKISEYGLPQPSPNMWKSYIPSSQGTVRTQPHPPSPMQKLNSHNLWTGGESDFLEEDSIADSYFEPELLPITVRTLMWSAPAVFVEVPSFGLFSVEARRQNFRSTTEIPAAIGLKKIQRVISSPLPVISTKKLWSLAGLARPTSKNWLLISAAKPTPSRAADSHTFLWTASPIVADVTSKGLFQRRSSRIQNYRNSELDPAALILTSKGRSKPGALSKLVSNRLWRRPSLLLLERDHDWISESSIRPSSPSIASETSSGRSSPDISDASSIASTSTKASSLFSLASISMRRTLSAKKNEDFIPPPPPPIDLAKYQSKLPVRQVSLKPTQRPPPKAESSKPFRQSGVLSYRDIFEAKLPLSSEKPQLPRFRRSVVPTKPVKPAHRAIRHKYRNTIAFRANWEDALNEAIIAGLPRFKATAADWGLALSEAVTLGAQSIEPLQTSLHSLAPVATEEVLEDVVGQTYSAVYNPAIVHPVFFTKTLVSDVDSIHPAAIGHTQLLRLTASVNDWDRALGKTASTDTTRMQRPTAFAFMWKDALKEAIAAGTPKEVKRISVIEIQQSTAMSNASDFTSYNVAFRHPVFFTTTLVSTAMDIHPACIGHCLVTSSHPMFKPSLWIPKLVSMTSLASIGLWRQQLSALEKLQPVLEELVSESKRRFTVQKTMKLPILESHELWQPAAIIPVSKNWLHTSSKSNASRELLFQRSVFTVTNHIGGLMWKPSTRTIRSTPDMFASIKHEYIQRTTTARSSPLPCIESTELYKVSEKSKPEMNWLNASIGTRVKVQDASIMWAVNGSSVPELFSDMTYERIKRVSGTPSAVLPHLESSELFKLKDQSSIEIDWLRLSIPPIVTIPSESMMWTASSVGTTCKPNLFADVKVNHARRVFAVRPSNLPRLSSTGLFKMNTEKKTEVDWLHVSVSKPVNDEPVTKFITIKSSVVAEPTFEQLMADVEALTEEEIAELLAAEEFKTEEDTIAKLVMDEPLVMNQLRVGGLWSPSPKVTIEETTGTWKISSSTAIARPDIFIKSDMLYSHKSSTPSQMSLPRLESSKLFIPSSTSKIEIDWLHNSCLSPVSRLAEILTPKAPENLVDFIPSLTVTNSKTWMPNSSTVAQVSVEGMWMAPITNNIVELSMFCEPRVRPLIRRNRQEVEKKIESTELWTNQRSTSESLKHWLLG